MKAAKLTKFIILSFFSASIIAGINSCAKRTTFLTSEIVPAARGEVKVSVDKNKNYVIKLDLNNLAEPTRLTPPHNYYVVWMENENGETKNIGQIKTSTGALSKNLKAKFETVSASKPTKIFITAEDEADVVYTRSIAILTTTEL